MEPVWLTTAKKYIGQKEVPGKVHNPFIVKLWILIKSAFRSDETAWCAAFVGGILEMCGIASTRSASARSYQTWGKKLTKPVPGCVVVFWRGSPTSYTGHVGFFVGYDRNRNLLVLGGNQGDKVSVASFSTARVVGYRWPLGVTMSGEKAKIYNTSTTLSTNEA
jgi:uncharacterized protein (TIGR02594 family)